MLLNPTSSQLKDKNIYPIAIIKDTDRKPKSKFHNQFLYVDANDNHNDALKKSVNKKGNPPTTTFNQLEIPMSCIFNLIPSIDVDKRGVYYIAGASGSGKSFIAKQLAQNYNKLYPTRDIFVVSKLDEDDTLDSMQLTNKKKIIRLDYSGWVDNPPNINDFNDAMVIYDDIDTIDGALGKAVHQFAEDIAIMGRKHHNGQGNITLLYITHHITNYKKSRLLLNEATHFVLYPQATASSQLTYLLKSRLGFEKDDIKALKKLGRWVCFSAQYPQYLISSQFAKVLHTD